MLCVDELDEDRLVEEEELDREDVLLGLLELFCAAVLLLLEDRLVELDDELLDELGLLELELLIGLEDELPELGELLELEPEDELELTSLGGSGATLSASS